MVEQMQFRGFLFPHNPERITVTRSDGLVSHFCPGKGDVVQRLGGKGMTVRCQGCFFGDSFVRAAAQLQAFRQAVGEGERGMLLMPGMAPFLAYLSELVFDAQGDGKIIPYTMTFTEAKEVTA